jgi:arylsulfatase A-like enzyme
VILFLVDDLGVMDTSVPFLTDAAGKPKKYALNEYYRTPQLERLAARGIRFSQFYAMNVCSPTRISLLTGQNAARHRTTNWIQPDQDNRGEYGPRDWNWQGLGPRSVTLPRILQAAGYRTIHVGKGHFGPRAFPGADPRQLGFDRNIGGASIGAPGSYYGQQNYGQGQRRNLAAVPHLEKYHGTDTFLTEALTLEAQAQMTEAVEEEQPFFLYMAHYAVHAPFQSDPRFADHYRDSGKPPAAQAFATLVEGMDRSLGQLLDHLERLGIAQNTLVFFLGDNGSDAPLGGPHEVACAAPLRGKKGSHYEGGMRVPMVAAWAAADAANQWQRRLPIAAGAMQNQVAAVYDLFPTLLHGLELPLPTEHATDGKSLDVLLTGQRDAERAEQFLMHYPHAPHRSDYFTVYREGPWKVIYHYRPSAGSEGSRYQLYHLDNDPFESRNLAMAEPIRLRQMMEGLVNQLNDCDAVYPLADDLVTQQRPQLP